MRKKNFSKYSLFIFVFILIFTLSACDNSNNGQEPYSVSGEVIDFEGNGVEDVQVYVKHGGGDTSTETDENGQWKISNITGTADVKMIEEGLPQNQTVTEKNSNINFIKCTAQDINVDTQNIDDILTVLTSEDYNGRLAGTLGNEKTEEYISTYFGNQGLEDPLENYRQEFTHNTLYPNSASKLEVYDSSGNSIKEYELLVDFTLQPGWSNTTINGEATGNVFLYENRNDEDVVQDGNIMLVPNEELDYEFGEEVQKANENGVVGVLIEKPKEGREYHYAYRNIVPPYDDTGDAPIVFYVSSSVYEDIKTNYMNVDNEIYLEVDYQLDKNVTSNNIIGYIPGETDETILIGAHFDHLGEFSEDIYLPGALDNASGTTAMMELARLISQIDKTPQKNIAFIGFNAEELGLLGSEHYVVENPLFELAKTELINLDMIGSIVESEPLNIYTTEETGDIPLKIKLYNLLDIGYQIDVEKKLGPVSDHFYFENGLTLLHDASEYPHSPNDTRDKLDIDKMKEIIKAVFTYILNEAYNTSAMDISKLAA